MTEQADKPIEIPEANANIDAEELKEYRAIRKELAELTGRNPVGAQYSLDSAATSFNFAQPSLYSLSRPKKTG